MIYHQVMGNSSMEFDPYSQWLGIPPQEQPADHYRLLGIGRFETSPEVIQAAADQRMSLVRKFQMGPKGRYTQELLNELSAAKLTLLDTTTRVVYDRSLRQAATIADDPVRDVAAPAALSPVRGDAPSLGDPSAMTSPADTLAMSSEPTSVAAVSMDHLASPAGDESDETESPAYAQPWFLILMATMLLVVGGLAVGLKMIMEQRGGGEPISGIATNGTDAADGTDTAPNADSVDLVESPEASEELPVLVYPEADGLVNLVASTARLRGGLQLETHEDQNVLTGWTSTDSSATWRFSVLKPGTYRVRLIYAVTQDAQGRSFVIDVGADGQEDGTDGLHHTVSMRGGPGVTIEDEDHLLIRRSGENTLVVWTNTPTPQGLMALQAIRLVPRGK